MASAAVMQEFEQLPPLYQRWVEQLLPGGIPRERIASCLDCAMCPKEGETFAPDTQLFHPDVKCCTYFPMLPNYLVGRAIEGDSAGAAALRAFIEDPVSRTAEVSPLAVTANYKFSLVYGAGNMFGKDPDMLCPYAIAGDTPEGPLCGIWQARNSVCSTYFCKHVRGMTGRRFWTSLRNLLLAVEEGLMWWAADAVMPDFRALLGPVRIAVENKEGLHLADNAWAQWPGTRTEFFQACAEKVDTLTWEEVVQICGVQVNLLSGEVNVRYESLMSSEAPGRVRAGAVKIQRAGAERVTLQGDPPDEDFEVPAVLVQLLPYFDGRPTAEILEEIKANHGIDIDLGLIRRLCDFGALKAVEESPAPRAD
jgi:hypothetical protein